MIPDTAPSETEFGMGDGRHRDVQDPAVFMKREHPPKSDNILLEAYEITGGDRQNDYGTPEENWNRIAAIASAMTDGKPVLLTAEVCVKVLIATKLARTVTSPKKRDNYVDLAGYAHVLSEVCL